MDMARQPHVQLRDGIRPFEIRIRHLLQHERDGHASVIMRIGRAMADDNAALRACPFFVRHRGGQPFRLLLPEQLVHVPLAVRMAGRLRRLVLPRIQQEKRRVAQADDIVAGAVAAGEIVQELITISAAHLVVSAHIEDRFLRRAIFAELRERPADDVFRQETAVHIAGQHEEIARFRIGGLQHLAENLMLFFQIELQVRREEEGIL